MAGSTRRRSNTSIAAPSLPSQTSSLTLASLTSSEKLELLALLQERARRQEIKKAEADLEQEAATTGARLSTFIRAAWHVLEPTAALKWGWALDAMCDHLEAISDGRLKKLLETVPPGMMKSLLLVFWTAYEWGPLKKPGLTYLRASHSAAIASRDVVKTGRLVASDWYQQRWPHVSLIRQSDDKIETSALGGVEATSAASMTGKRADRVILDDPISVEDADSTAVIERVERRIKETLPTRLNDPLESAVIMIMQRVNERDPAGIVLDGKFGYEHLCLPMEFESDRRCETSIGFVDPRHFDGELLFEERFPRDVVESLKSQMTAYAYAGQMQQRPVPRGGAIFREAWLVNYDELPQLRYRMIWADTAQKAGEENDYSVFQCWGSGADGYAYLIDQTRGKWEAPELRRRARAFWKKHAVAMPAPMGALRAMKVEDKVSGTGLIQDLRRGDEAQGEPPIPVVGIPRPSEKSKITRAYDVELHFESGLVRVPMSAPWFPAWKAEMLAFPKGAHDDQVDATMDAVTEICSGGGRGWEGFL